MGEAGEALKTPSAKASIHCTTTQQGVFTNTDCSEF
jgi:hypothetical protein